MLIIAVKLLLKYVTSYHVKLRMSTVEPPYNCNFFSPSEAVRVTNTRQVALKAAKQTPCRPLGNGAFCRCLAFECSLASPEETPYAAPGGSS